MEEVIIIFDSRKEEIHTYFEYVQEIMGNHAQLLLQDKSVKPFSMDFKHIILANGFLLLYNLVESTFSNAIEAIYKTMIAEGCRYKKADRGSDFLTFSQHFIGLIRHYSK